MGCSEHCLGLITSSRIEQKNAIAHQLEEFPLNMQPLKSIVSSLNVLTSVKVHMAFSGLIPARGLFLLLVR